MRRRKPDNRVNLSSNELVHPRARELIAECVRKIEPETWRPYFPADPVVNDIASHLAVPPAHLLVTPGSNMALRAVCRDYLASAAKPHLILQSPNYPVWESEAAELGLTVTRVHGKLDERAQAQGLVAAARAHTGCLIAVSEPNGPTGRAMESADLDALVDTTRRRSHLLVIDACYQAFHAPWTVQLARHGAALVVVQSLSKSHGMAGARVAVVAAESSRVERLARGQLEEAVGGPSMLLAQMLLAHTTELETVWREIAHVREDAADRIDRRGMRPLPSGGNFLTVDLGSTRAAEATTAALSEVGYRVRDLSDVTGLEGHLRFTVGDAATTNALLSAWERLPSRCMTRAGERV